MKYDIDDEVRFVKFDVIKDNFYDTHSYLIGKVGVIKSILYTSSFPYEVWFDNRCLVLKEDEIELFTFNKDLKEVLK